MSECQLCGEEGQLTQTDITDATDACKLVVCLRCLSVIEKNKRWINNSKKGGIE